MNSHPSLSKKVKNGLCDDGKLGNCQRFIWNCQWAYHSQSKGFCAQRNRCVVGSRVVYGESNQIVLDELAKGWRCSLKSCLKRFNPNNPEDVDGHFIANPDGGNTRFCSDRCLNDYGDVVAETARELEGAKVEMADFALEIAQGVSLGRLAEIDARKTWLNEHIPSFKNKAARDAGIMCRICTQPWAEGIGECMVGANGLRYHSPDCYQKYLDGIAKNKAARDAGIMCRICTQPWAEGIGECMVGENGLRYHSTACYQSYLDGIAKAKIKNDEDYTRIYNLSFNDGSPELVQAIIQENSYLQNIWDFENKIETFIDDLPAAMVKRDLNLERENSKKILGEFVTGRMGNLSQWRIIVAFYAECFGLNKSFYSGETLTTLRRAGLLMMSFQRSNDLIYYFENFLRWMLYICSSLEQRMFPKEICKSWQLKMEHLGLIVTLCDEGREKPSLNRDLTSTEVAKIKNIVRNQETGGRNKGKGRGGDEKEFLKACSENYISKTLSSVANWEKKNSRMLSWVCEAPNSFF